MDGTESQQVTVLGTGESGADLLDEELAVVFTDMVGSTELAQQAGEGWQAVLAAHHVVVRERFEAIGAVESGSYGDGFSFLTDSLSRAVQAAVDVIETFERDRGEVQVRIGIHWGKVGFTSGTGFFGLALHHGSRVADAANAAQVLLSGAAADRLRDPSRQLVDHGQFWLKGLPRPDRLVEVLRDGEIARAPRALRDRRPDHPIPRAAFHDRAELFASVVATLAESSGRVISLVGTGGVGKTRIALEILRTVRDRPTRFVDVSHIDSAALVMPAVARAIDVDASAPDLDALVERALERQRCVLVLDNLEQVIDAAPIGARLAELAPAARVIATSRLPLRVANEIVFEVDPFDEDAPAVAMFVELSGAGELDHDRVAALCRSIDRLPVAVELAAGRLEAFGLDELTRQLDRSVRLLSAGRRDLPERHRTIAATVDWSYRLLSQPARQVFCTLSQFPAGATLAALEQVVNAGSDAGSDAWSDGAFDLDPDTVVDAIAELVEHRLVQRAESVSGGRYRLLRVIRDVAESLLAETANIGAVRGAISGYLRGTSRRLAVSVGGDDERDSHVRAIEELDNFGALFRWAEDPAHLDRALAVAADLLTLWWHDHLVEGRRHLEVLTEQPGAPDSRHQARALVARSILSTYSGGTDDSLSIAQRAVQAARATDPGNNLCAALQQVAIAQSARGEAGYALDAAYEVIERAQALPDILRAVHYVGVGPVLLSDGSLDEAERVFGDAIEIFDRDAPSWLAAAPLARLGECALRRGDLDEAARMAIAGVERWAVSPGTNGRARAWAGLARVRWCQGQVDEALAIARDAAITAVDLNSVGDLPWALIVGAAVAASRDRLDESKRLFQAAVALARVRSQPILGTIRHDLAGAHEAVQVGLALTPEWWLDGDAEPVGYLLGLLEAL